jgi:hypothetical protein
MDRELELLAKLAVTNEILNMHLAVEKALVVRCGGSVKITQEEIDFCDKTYAMTTTVTASPEGKSEVSFNCKLR